MAGCSGETADRCENGGSCVLVDETEVCNCTSKFAGDHCEMDVSVKRPCEDWICHNGGVCHLVRGFKMCTLTKKYKYYYYILGRVAASCNRSVCEAGYCG